MLFGSGVVLLFFGGVDCFWICFVYYVVLVFVSSLHGFGDLVGCSLVGLV